MSDFDVHPGFELRYAALQGEGRGFSFPCDAQGRVELDALSECTLANYLYARAVVGRELQRPEVVSCQPLAACAD